MVQILEDQPSFGSQLMRSNMNTASALAQAFAEQMQQKKQVQQENEALRGMGVDLTGIHDPEIRKTIITNSLRGKSQAQQKTLSAAEQGLSTVQRQKERLQSGLLGPKISLMPGQESKLFKAISPEGRQVRSAYEQAGKELIQLAATLPIRNQREFETLAHKLYDPTLTESEISGILDEMEAHIKDAIASSGGEISPSLGNQSLSSKKGKVSFDINNPEHKAKRDQVLKKVGGDRKKAEEILNREFE